ncbi:hypothetical protein CIPAW_01G268300 [Carya illinoinensis]|uniref:Uncharacterized protein n=1 Tax=Carya illinoinensis TaxID=32201 RepID=A0A8T1RSR2_CARIL|nr:hypothetical protein CIPAW_01G268300 [Carya illinoinensis]
MGLTTHLSRVALLHAWSFLTMQYAIIVYKSENPKRPVVSAEASSSSFVFLFFFFMYGAPFLSFPEDQADGFRIATRGSFFVLSHLYLLFPCLLYKLHQLNQHRTGTYLIYLRIVVILRIVL